MARRRDHHRPARAARLDQAGEGRPPPHSLRASPLRRADRPPHRSAVLGRPRPRHGGAADQRGGGEPARGAARPLSWREHLRARVRPRYSYRDPRRRPGAAASINLAYAGTHQGRTLAGRICRRPRSTNIGRSARNTGSTRAASPPSTPSASSPTPISPPMTRRLPPPCAPPIATATASPPTASGTASRPRAARPAAEITAEVC